MSRNSSQVSSSGSRASSVALARAKEAAQVAVLQAEVTILQKRQALEEQKFSFKQEETHVNLEAAIAKSTAKERAFTAITSPGLVQLQPLKLEPRFNDEDSVPATPAKNPGQERVCRFDPDFPSFPAHRTAPEHMNHYVVNKNLQKETIALQRQQTDLQRQQNRIFEFLVHNQNRNKLPQPCIPVFDGNPLEYRSFIRAFESLIESRTFNNTDLLYYLGQFTAGDVKELVRSHHHLLSDVGYDEACRLLEKKFGEEYHIASAYEIKALNWPNIKTEDGVALNRFSFFF